MFWYLLLYLNRELTTTVCHSKHKNIRIALSVFCFSHLAYMNALLCISSVAFRIEL